jgi:hypothetical protein
MTVQSKTLKTTEDELAGIGTLTGVTALTLSL